MQPRPFSFAPLLGRPPGGSLVGALKRIVFRPLIVATSARVAILVPAAAGVAAAKARPPPLRIETVRGTCRAGRAPRRERGAVVLNAVVVLRRSVCLSAETPA